MQTLAVFSLSLSLVVFLLVHSSLAKKTNAEVCSHSSECNQDAGLYCLSPSDGVRKCGCPTNETVFDDQKARCVGKVGYNCVHHENKTFCPTNAECSHQDPKHAGLYYYESKCFCEVNFFANSEGTCTATQKFGETCDEKRKCDELARMKCNEGICTCEFGEDQYFDKKKRICVSHYGGKCSSYYACVNNARCEGIQAARTRTFSSIRGNGVEHFPPVAVGKCICEYGFTPTKDKKCLAGYRQTCSGSQPCNPEDDLECQDGSCNCKNPLHMYYEYNLKKCMKLVGATCDPANDICVDHAVCNNGFCGCEQKYSKTPYRRCMLGFNETCQNEKCNLHSGLTCKNGLCACVDETLSYNDQLKACVSRINSPCGKIGQAGDYGKEPFYVSCEPNAICKQEPSGDANTLFCRPV